MLLSHSEVIDAFGGVRPLAEGIGISPKRAIHWPRRGIPAKYWHLVTKIAAALDPPLSVTADDLARTRPETAEAA
jgi:hypothetical protein